MSLSRSTSSSSSIAASGRSDEPLLAPAASSPSPSPSSPSSPSNSRIPASRAASAQANPLRHQPLDQLVNNLALQARVEELERQLKERKRKAKRFDRIERLVWQSHPARGAQDDARFRYAVEDMVLRERERDQRAKKPEKKQKKKMVERFMALFARKKDKET